MLPQANWYVLRGTTPASPGSTATFACRPSSLHTPAHTQCTYLTLRGPQLVQVRVELYDTRRTKFIAAHNSGLAALALSANGKLLATAGEKGTLVRTLLLYVLHFLLRCFFTPKVQRQAVGGGGADRHAGERDCSAGRSLGAAAAGAGSCLVLRA